LCYNDNDLIYNEEVNFIMLNLNFLQMKKWKLILVKLFSDGIRVLTFLQRKNLALRFDQISESNFVYWNLFSNYLFWKILHLKSRKNQDHKRRLRWEHLWSFSLLWLLITEFCLTIGHFFWTKSSISSFSNRNQNFK